MYRTRPMCLKRAQVQLWYFVLICHFALQVGPSTKVQWHKHATKARIKRVNYMVDAAIELNNIYKNVFLAWEVKSKGCQWAADCIKLCD